MATSLEEVVAPVKYVTRLHIFKLFSLFVADRRFCELHRCFAVALLALGFKRAPYDRGNFGTSMTDRGIVRALYDGSY